MLPIEEVQYTLKKEILRNEYGREFNIPLIE
jgi:hypothetical protein